MKFFRIVIFFVVCLLLLIFVQFRSVAQTDTQTDNWVDLTGFFCSEEEYYAELSDSNDSFNSSCNCSKRRVLDRRVYGSVDYYCKSNISQILETLVPEGFGWCGTNRDAWWCDPDRYDIDYNDLVWVYESRCTSGEASFEDCSFIKDDVFYPVNISPTGYQSSRLGEQCVLFTYYRNEYYYSNCREPAVDELPVESSTSECPDVNIRINGLPGQRIRVRSKCD